ncbi:MAG: hypothetical protein COA79_17190 [Planctomycetota bacterium]|nr:MAG: hypothetical protein COA79_17190 [Planctomycetota bacterium]
MEFQLDKIIIGHNQFFGVDHMSSERGAKRAQYFSKIKNIIDLLHFAIDKGATGLMLSTHPRAKEIAKAILADPALKDNLNIYILLPYVAKYIRMANEKGMINMITDALKEATLKDKIGIALKGGVGFFKKDQISILKSLIDLEMVPFRGLKIKTVFLHNNLTDLNLGLGFTSVLHFFNEYIPQKFSCKGGFCTLNFDQLVKSLSNIDITHPVIMAPFNGAGYQMNPNPKVCEETMLAYPTHTIAMSILAAGLIKPAEAIGYLKKIPQIKSYVVGASSHDHIVETYTLILDELGK